MPKFFKKHRLAALEIALFVGVLSLALGRWFFWDKPVATDRSPATLVSFNHRVIDLGCISENERRFQVKADNIMFTARLCAEDKFRRIEGWSNTSRTMIFSQLEGDKQQLVTNYIPLQAGENRLQFDYMTESSQSGHLRIIVENKN